MRMSETIADLAAALAAAQGAMKNAVKDATNPHFRSKYADLASVRDACFPALAAHGLSVVQTVGAADGRVRITTLLLHASGQWISDDTVLTPKDDSPQALGSCVTYGRRYALAAIAGVAPEDDDGEAAQGRGSKPSAAPVARAVEDVPAGFAAWWDDMTATADNGIAALEAAWKGSAPELRAYVNAVRRPAWDALKARAAKAVAA